MRKFFAKVFTPRNVAGLNLFAVGFCLALAVVNAMNGDLRGVVLNLCLALLNLFCYINLQRLDN